MKRLFLSMMAMAAITTTLTLTSCGSDDDGNDTSDGASILAADGKTLMGNLTGKQTLEEGEYIDRKSTRLNSSHRLESRMPSSA